MYEYGYNDEFVHHNSEDEDLGFDEKKRIVKEADLDEIDESDENGDYEDLRETDRSNEDD